MGLARRSSALPHLLSAHSVLAGIEYLSAVTNCLDGSDAACGEQPRTGGSLKAERRQSWTAARRVSGGLENGRAAAMAFGVLGETAERRAAHRDAHRCVSTGRKRRRRR